MVGTAAIHYLYAYMILQLAYSRSYRIFTGMAPGKWRAAWVVNGNPSDAKTGRYKTGDRWSERTVRVNIKTATKTNKTNRRRKFKTSIELLLRNSGQRIKKVRIQNISLIVMSMLIWYTRPFTVTRIISNYITYDGGRFILSLIIMYVSLSKWHEEILTNSSSHNSSSN